MITPNELRIGNILKQGVVTRIQEQSARVRYQYEGQDKYSFVAYEVLDPVELSDDCLPAKDSGWRLEKTRHRRYNVWIGGNYLTTVEFVHEYQNLVFAITGREMEVKI